MRTALPLSVCLYPHAVVVSVHCWSCISREAAEMFHPIHHLDSLQYKHILQNAMASSVRLFNPMEQPSSSMTLLFTKLILFRIGYRYRPILNSLTGHHERLIWNPSTMFGVIWKGKCRKLGLLSLPEQQWPLGQCVLTPGREMLHLSDTFDHRVGIKSAVKAQEFSTSH